MLRPTGVRAEQDGQPALCPHSPTAWDHRRVQNRARSTQTHWRARCGQLGWQRVTSMARWSQQSPSDGKAPVSPSPGIVPKLRACTGSLTAPLPSWKKHQSGQNKFPFPIADIKNCLKAAWEEQSEDLWPLPGSWPWRRCGGGRAGTERSGMFG